MRPEKFAKQVGTEKTNAVCVRGVVHGEMSDLGAHSNLQLDVLKLVNHALKEPIVAQA